MMDISIYIYIGLYISWDYSEKYLIVAIYQRVRGEGLFQLSSSSSNSSKSMAKKLRRSLRVLETTGMTSSKPKSQESDHGSQLDSMFKTYWCVLRRVSGWVAGGCWDYYENSYCGSFPKIPYKTHQ